VARGGDIASRRLARHCATLDQPDIAFYDVLIIKLTIDYIHQGRLSTGSLQRCFRAANCLPKVILMVS
jgi:hypothetical protein